MRRITESFDAQDVLQMPIGFTGSGFTAVGADYGMAIIASNAQRAFSVAPAIGVSWEGFYLYVNDNNPAQNNIPFHFLSNGSAVQLMLIRNPYSALLELRTGGTVAGTGVDLTGSVLRGTGIHPLAQGRKYHVQVGYNVTGTLEVRIDGIADIQVAGIGGLIFHNTIYFRSIQASGVFQTHFDSFYLNDDTGAEDNSWGGIVRMKTSTVNADGAYTAWPLSPAVGTGFSKLTDIPNDGDTTHIYSNTDAQKSSFVPVAHGIVSPATIKAQTARWVIKKITAGQVIPFYRVGGVDYPMPAALDLGVDYGVIIDRRTTNPATAVAWALGDTFEVGLESNI